MTLPSSGTITLSQIVAEFGGTAPHSLTEYYRGGAYVANTPGNSGIPTSGTIKLTDFYGASAFSPVSRTYTSGSSATETAPAGCSNVLIGVWGGGGAGGGCGRFSDIGGDGGSGGSKTNTNIKWNDINKVALTGTSDIGATATLFIIKHR